MTLSANDLVLSVPLKAVNMKKFVLASFATSVIFTITSFINEKASFGSTQGKVTLCSGIVVSE